MLFKEQKFDFNYIQVNFYYIHINFYSKQKLY